MVTAGGGGVVNQRNVKQKRKKYFPLLSVERIYQHVHLGRAAEIHVHQHRVKFAFWNLRFAQSFPFNKDPVLCASSSFSLKKQMQHCVSPKQNLNVKRKTSITSLFMHMLHYLFF